MCVPSVVADDWITKGFHITVNEVELGVRPDHRGTVVFVSIFSSVPKGRVDEAVRIARRECLADAAIRRQWLRRIDGAMVHLYSQIGSLRESARGRLAELNFLRIALTRIRD